ncbi:histidine kinase [Chromatium okenii]|uniref:PAS domain S-box protein n=1 Tax=Chromatium okenii TaxID=61644 RepID=UPI0019072F3C|nr:PAS domain S-box protein [Chromatium okenii]MBK1640406.1 histidine kinase [Chromatium okenii]
MSEQLRILLLEDHPADAELIERFLKKSGLVLLAQRVDQREPFLTALNDFRPDAILADYSLPQFDGLQALALVRQRDPDLPFIFVTGALGEEGAVELLCKGANDYVLKHLLTRLPMALERALTTSRQQKALRHAEQSLRDSEERFRAIVETTLDWIWEVDVDGCYTYVSPASQRLLGYAPAEMLGRHFTAFMPPAAIAQVSAHFASIFATAAPFSLLENTCQHRDGSLVEMETSGIPILSASGELLGYRGIDRDVTERKRQVATLLLQARRASALLELPRAAESRNEVDFMQVGLELAEELTDSTISFIHFVNDDQETIELVTWSQRTLERYCSAAYDSHYPVSEAGLWAEALRERAPVMFNDYATAPKQRGLPAGHAALTRLISVPVLDGEQVRMIAGVGNKSSLYTELDVESIQLIANEIWRIVRQRRAEQALRESEERFHALFANMRSGVCVYDATADGLDFCFREVNCAVEHIEGLNRADLSGRRVTEVFPNIVASGLLEVFQRVWRSGESEYVPPVFYEDERISGWRENFVYRLPHGELVTVYDDVTARQALEQALEESRERLELALEGSDMGMWDWQIPSGTVQLNDRWAQMLGYQLAELEPLTIQMWLDLTHPDDLAQAQEKLAQHFQGITPYYECEIRLRHKNGHWLWMLDRGKVVARDAAGQPLRMAGTHLDITARKRADEELHKLLLAVEQSPTSIVITDLNAKIEYANPAFTRVSGYTLDEANHQNPRILQSGHTPRHVYDALWATLTDGEVWRGEFQNRRKDGSDYVELAIISPVRQPDGRVTHYLAVKEDITAHKRVEEELKHYRLHLEELVEIRTAELKSTEERSRLILESSADGLYGEDTEGFATFINPAACTMLGYTAAQVLGQSMHDLIHHTRADGSPYPKAECPIQRSLKAGQVLRQDEDVFWHADGHPFPVAYSSHPMYRNGVLIGAVVSFFDISVQKQTEAAREAALVEAERLARLKSEFLANMSHEIRTPLNAVLGFAQIGVRQNDGRKAQDFFKRILDSGQLLLGIVNDILDFSKIEAGKLSIDPGVMDVHAVIDHAADQLRGRAADKQLELRVALAPELPATCAGDALRVTQVLGNLLSNAIKFTERGSVRVTAAVEIHEQEWLCLSVADTGIGMTETHVARLFRPFEQADGSITRRFGGTGLGLAISKRLVDMMGGTISVTSQVGVGTCFRVCLPLREPQGVINALTNAPTAGSGFTPLSVQHAPRLHGLVILVAEDNPTNRLVLEELLRDEGCWLVQVENGAQAVERVRHNDPNAFDLILMDVQMPVLDGIEATRQIHALRPHLPIIGLTAHALAAERQHCLAAGMVAHVAKPVDLERLIAVIVQHTTPLPAAPPLIDTRTTAPLLAAPPLPVPSAPPALVDWQALAQRYRQRLEFLPKLLESMLVSSTTLAADLRESASASDFTQLAFLAHGLKSTAGNLFAVPLQTLAAATERSARAKLPAAINQAFQLAELLEMLLSEIQAWQRERAPAPLPAAPVTLEPALVMEVIARLETLLMIDDTAANTTFDENEALLRQLFGELAQQLGRQIERFDYQAALETLRTLKV